VVCQVAEGSHYERRVTEAQVDAKVEVWDEKYTALCLEDGQRIVT